ncbi:bifunctional DNA primase/polymerase [Actinoplanes flavus]|uniref:Bifunctional DNA primase/polymerase n=1 Tax=Actinoplanes flavus TaxID=2820290 RepID=A0ABS3UDY7_9ACTN|nr:bifunctional DNA primase/polymerase [Actinoplanes flavus]MBO3736661.1 bifunctional DNA primase/polymerase [Actinoplanes flavus]
MTGSKTAPSRTRHRSQPADPNLRRAALWYAKSGIPVLPLHTPAADSTCSCRSSDACESVGKHPRLRHGLHDASRDPVLIRSWWQQWPHANVGLATGTALDVCDMDTGAGLAAVLDVLDVVKPAAPLVRTGNGWHLWYASTDLPNRVGLLPGVDWRGTGGLVVAPPSAHVSGVKYVFQQPWDGLALPSCPPSLRALVPVPAASGSPTAETIIRFDRYARAALDGELQRIQQAPVPVYSGGTRIAGGERNNTLHLAAFRMGQLAARGNVDEAAARQELTEAAMQVGLSRVEAQRTIDSGWRAGRERPRR